MRKHIIAMVAIIVLMASLVFMKTHHLSALVSKSEPFTNTDPMCPTTAERGPDGNIHVQPGNKTFKTLVEYTQYLADLYANGAACIPPKVESHKEPVRGMFGGLGNSTQPPSVIANESATRTVLETNFNGESGPNARTPIDKLDDYEYTRVFESERQSRNKLDEDSKNDLLKKRATDWAILPFNSETRAKQEDEFIAGRMESANRDPKTGILFNTMEGKTLEPPDVEAARLREQQILASYRPTDVSKHIVDNDTEAVARLVMAEYGQDREWEPVVEQVGDNQWQVTELRPKARKERYEDGTTANVSMMDSTKTINPRPTIDIDDRIQNDPYFDKNAPGANPSKFWNYNDFRAWTPGLERMFAPTADTKAWY